MTGTNPRVAPDLVRSHAPKPADLTDDVLFADVWQRPDLYAVACGHHLIVSPYSSR